MLFEKPRGKPEKEGAQRAIVALRADGWFVKRLNVSAGQYSTPGFPDYYAVHKFRKLWRWIEFKIRGGSLELSQVELWTKWIEAGVHVYVISDEKDIPLLYKPEGNWWQFCIRGKIR